jgi:hypothetical protein
MVAPVWDQVALMLDAKESRSASLKDNRTPLDAVPAIMIHTDHTYPSVDPASIIKKKNQKKITPFTLCHCHYGKVGI